MSPMLSLRPARHAPWSYPGPLRVAPVSDVVRVKVVLIEIVPPIWRRLRVPVHLTLRRFHAVLQEAIGWKDLQPHRFRVGEIHFGMPSEPADALRDSRWVTIQDLVSAGTRSFTYEYGAGGGWAYDIRIEALEGGNPDNQRAICLGGERACPPEDSGGPDDYVDRVLARAGFDPERFDLAEVNAALSGLGRSSQIP